MQEELSKDSSAENISEIKNDSSVEAEQKENVQKDDNNSKNETENVNTEETEEHTQPVEEDNKTDSVSEESDTVATDDFSDSSDDTLDETKTEITADNKDSASVDAEDSVANEQEDSAEIEKPLLPRRRKIIKNNQLIVSTCIVIVVAAALFVWKSFFNNSLAGKWYYVHDGEYSETIDDPIESNDSIEQVNKYSQRVVYEFTDNGKCSVTLGTLSVTGGYQTYQTQDGSVISASVYYQNMPLFYGSYKYDLSGNIFTGRKLTIYGSESGNDIVLEQGEGSNPLTRYEDEELDDRLTGKWKDSEYNQYYTFTNDGHMIIEIDGRLIIDNVYTVFEDGLLLTKYYADTEQTYSYNYSFENDELTLNGNKLVRVE